MTDEASAILQRLPEVLRRSPEMRFQVYEILSEEFSPRRETARLLDEIKAMREESNRRFEAQQKETKALREDSNRRFEAGIQEMRDMRRSLGNLEHSMGEVKGSVGNLEHSMGEVKDSVGNLDRTVHDIQHSVDLQVGGFTRRAGHHLEDTVAGALRYALGMRGIRAEDIRLRQKVEDREGLIGPRGRTYEFDILVTDGQTYIFEVKSAPDEEDVDRFADKCDLACQTMGKPDARRVLVTMAKDSEVARRCEERGVVMV